jgi:putative sugar O-methyltransferase
MNTKYDLLNLMLEDMKNQDDLYKPTSFWKAASNRIIKTLEENDIKDFRVFRTTRGLFVPGYTDPDYLLNRKKYDDLIENFDKFVNDKRLITRFQRLLNGHTGAFNDYRVLKSSNIDKKPYLDKISESSIGNPIEQHTFENRNFSRSFLNYTLGLSLLKKTVDTSDINTVMEIGGGFGTLGEILLGDERNNIFYINADIPPVGFVSSYYLQEIFGEENIACYNTTKDLETIDIKNFSKSYKALNLCAWQVPKLQGKIDLFVNFISFQEMEPDVVKNYCKHVERLQPKYILLRNMLEGKKKNNDTYRSGVEEPILGNDYDKFLPNYELVTTDSAIYGFITEDNFHSQLRVYKRK